METLSRGYMPGDFLRRPLLLVGRRARTYCQRRTSKARALTARQGLTPVGPSKETYARAGTAPADRRPLPGPAASRRRTTRREPAGEADSLESAYCLRCKHACLLAFVVIVLFPSIANSCYLFAYIYICIHIHTCLHMHMHMYPYILFTRRTRSAGADARLPALHIMSLSLSLYIYIYMLCNVMSYHIIYTIFHDMYIIILHYFIL